MAEDKVVTEEKPVETKPEDKPGEVKTEEKKETRTYSQDDVDSILKKVRKNERYRTRKEVEAFYKGLDTGRGTQTPAAKVEEKEPQRDQFPSYEEYIEARADFRAKKAVSEQSGKMEKEAKERQKQESQAKAATDFQKKTREKFPDIDDLLEDVGDMPIYHGVQEAIMDSALGPDIFRELVSNPKELERLMSLSEAAAIREVGKLEAKLEAKATPPKAEVKTPSKAPNPVAPPASGATSTNDAASDDDDVKTWMRKENARLAKLRQAGA